MDKKITCILTSLVLLILQVVPVMANTTSESASGSANGSQDCIVSFSDDGDNAPIYQVSLPARIDLHMIKNEETGKYYFASNFLYGATGELYTMDEIHFLPNTLDRCVSNHIINYSSLRNGSGYSLKNTDDPTKSIYVYVNTCDRCDLDIEKRFDCSKRNIEAIPYNNAQGRLIVHKNDETGDLESIQDSRGDLQINCSEIKEAIDYVADNNLPDRPFYYKLGDIRTSREYSLSEINAGTYTADITFTFGLNLDSYVIDNM